MQTDTIAAVSTPPGSGGIGIVRVSGPLALPILGKLFSRPAESLAANTLTHGNISHGGRIIDEVLVGVMRAPHSYTREDVAEINCHGGRLAVTQTLRAVLEHGARHAEPGEFTKRAFLNGRLNLSQAEAVIDIINAKTSAALSAAQSQLSGTFARTLEAVSAELINMLARLEVSIDYPEYDEAEVNLRVVSRTAAQLAAQLRKLAETFEAGRYLRDGVQTVILGRPNVGKSSLLNHLLQADRAIVTDIPGTTRDLLSESVNVGGVPLVLTDTAGYRQTDDPIEAIGVQRGLERLPVSQLVLLMLDASRELTPDDHELIAQVRGKTTVVLANKADLTPAHDPAALEAACAGLSHGGVIRMSLTSGLGTDILQDRLASLFRLGEIDTDDGAVITNIRHEQALRKAVSALDSAVNACESALPEDIVSIELTSAANAIGEITGATISEDILDKIFSEFCLGK